MTKFIFVLTVAFFSLFSFSAAASAAKYQALAFSFSSSGKVIYGYKVGNDANALKKAVIDDCRGKSKFSQRGVCKKTAMVFIYEQVVVAFTCEIQINSGIVLERLNVISSGPSAKEMEKVFQFEMARGLKNLKRKPRVYDVKTIGVCGPVIWVKRGRVKTR